MSTTATVNASFYSGEEMGEAREGRGTPKPLTSMEIWGFATKPPENF